MLHRDLSRSEAFRLLGFSHSPFGSLDDPASAWPRPSVLANVRKALAGGAAALAITGDEGYGKTSLIGPLKIALGRGFTVGVLPTGPAEGEVQRVLSAFEPAGAALSRLDARNRLRGLLAGRHREGRPCVLLVDDAHRMPEPLASVIERSVGSGADGGAALRVVLAAPRAALRRSPARVLPRVEIRLGPLRPEEVVAYIRHRLRAAGGPVDLFEEAAACELASASGGAPPALNRLCTACLEAVAARGARRIDVDVVRAVTGAVTGAVSGAVRSAPPKAPLGGARPDRAAEAGADAAAAARPFDDLRVPAGSDEFLFARSPKPVSSPKPTPSPKPASHGRAERVPAGTGPAGTGPAVVPAIPAPAPSSAGAPPAPARRPGPMPRAGAEDVRAPGPARAAQDSVGGSVGASAGPRAVEPVAARGASRGWIAASAGAMVVVGTVIGVGIGWRMAPWSFAAGPGDPLPRAAASIGAGAEGAEAPSAPTAPAVMPAAERAPSGDAAASPVSPAAPPPEWEAEARTLYERATGLAAKDPDAAIVAYARAALRGHARSARYLGQIYEIGDGVEPSPALARAWYRHAEAGPEAAVRGASAQAAQPAPASGTPTPMFSARTPQNAVELVWAGADGGEAGYRVEFARDPLGEAVGSLVTPVSATLAAVPDEVAFWRVAVGGAAAEGGWRPIGSPAAP